MNDLDAKIVAGFCAVLGAALGVVVFAFALGGAHFVFTGDTESTWRGPLGLCVCTVVGGVLGWLSYPHRHASTGVVGVLAQDTAGGFLIGRRFLVIGGCLIGLIFVWQLAKSLR